MFFYNLAIRCYAAFLGLAALFNGKAKLWVKGRQNWRADLAHKLAQARITQPIWFHCASLGEFEQGRPLIEAIKAQDPQQQVLLTFFSPSGFEVRRNYGQADVVAYLPIDTRSNALDFIKLVKPKMAVFVKYEFWLNYLFQLKQQRVPTFLVSAIFRPHQPFFKWYGGIFRKALDCYNTIFTQDQHSLDLLGTLHVKQAIIAGDTRLDRVLDICERPKHIEEAKLLTQGRFTIIGGSTWPKDEQLLLEAYGDLKKKYPDLKLIIAPHEINQQNMERLWNLIGAQQLSCQFITDQPDLSKDVLIVNTMGYLSSVYQYGQVAVIGGGFSDGIHNILEPSVYGLPVLFGPKYQKFREAEDLIRLQGAFSFSTREALSSTLSQLIHDKDFYHATASLASGYVRGQAGATKKIMQHLKPLL